MFRALQIIRRVYFIILSSNLVSSVRKSFQFYLFIWNARESYQIENAWSGKNNNNNNIIVYDGEHQTSKQIDYAIAEYSDVLM